MLPVVAHFVLAVLEEGPMVPMVTRRKVLESETVALAVAPAPLPRRLLT